MNLRRVGSLLFSFSAFAAITVTRLEGQCVPPAVDSWLPDAGTHLEFGLEVAVSGDWAIVGAAYEDVGTLVDAGAAYVYHWDGTSWSRHSKLTAESEAIAQDNFGIDVDIDGDTIVVGVREAGMGHVGRAYVFELDAQSQWVRRTKLVRAMPSGTGFGDHVAVSGDTIVVGARGDLSSCSGGQTECGAAYVFVEPPTGWISVPMLSETARLVSPLPENGALFGAHVQIDGTTAAVAAWHEDYNGVVDSGVVYVFEEPPSGWASGTSIPTRLAPRFPQANSSIGVRVHVHADRMLGDRVAIGAPQFVTTDPFVGAFVVEEPPGGWSGGTVEVEPNVTSSYATVQDTFGRSIAIDGDVLVVGAATGDPPGTPDTGHALAFARQMDGSWLETHHLRANLVDMGGAFPPSMGGGVALEGSRVLVGAHLDDNAAGPDAGTVLVYDLTPCLGFFVVCAGDGSHPPGCPCDNESAPGAGEGCKNSSFMVGGTLRDAAGGSTSVSADDLRLDATYRASNSGLLLVNTSILPGSAAFDGLACVGGGPRVLPGADNGMTQPFGDVDLVAADGVRNLGSTTPGSGLYGLVNATFPGFFVAGVTYYAQFWYRDVLCGPPPAPCVTHCTTPPPGAANFTNALRWTSTP